MAHHKNTDLCRNENGHIMKEENDMPDTKLLIHSKDDTVTITDGITTMPIHVIHAYSNGIMVCSISNPEAMEDVEIDVSDKYHLSNDPTQPIFIDTKDNKCILHLELAVCRLTA